MATILQLANAIMVDSFIYKQIQAFAIITFKILIPYLKPQSFIQKVKNG